MGGVGILQRLSWRYSEPWFSPKAGLPRRSQSCPNLAHLDWIGQELAVTEVRTPESFCQAAATSTQVQTGQQAMTRKKPKLAEARQQEAHEGKLRRGTTSIVLVPGACDCELEPPGLRVTGSATRTFSADLFNVSTMLKFSLPKGIQEHK